MAKNILNNNVVHYAKDMMKIGHKRILPAVGMSCSFDVSAFLFDGPASHCKAFLPEKQDMPIKLRNY